MFEPTSRYYLLETAVITLPDGREVAYKRRRFLPDGDTLPLIAELAPNQAERIDHFAQRALGNPLQFWRICDANNAMNPLELVAENDRLLRVPLPQA